MKVLNDVSKPPHPLLTNFGRGISEIFLRDINVDIKAVKLNLKMAHQLVKYLIIPNVPSRLPKPTDSHKILTPIITVCR